MATELAIVEVETKAVSLRDRARAIVVWDQFSHDVAAELYLGLTALEKEINAVHDPAIAAAHTAHKAALIAKAKCADPVAEAKRIIKPKITSWEAEQERIRQELERKAREEAYRRQQEEERKAREATEAAHKEAERLEEEARLKLAMEAEQAGANADEVNEILETQVLPPVVEVPYEPPVFVPPVVAPTFQKTKGFTSRASYSCEVVNLGELVRAAAVDSSLLFHLQPNMTSLNSLARSMKETFKLPGCKLHKDIV